RRRATVRGGGGSAGHERASRDMQRAGGFLHRGSLRDGGGAARQRRAACPVPLLMRQITAPELKAWLEDPSRERPVLLDVREPWEVEICRIEDARHIPMRELPGRAGEIDPEVPVVAIC